jgi:hypothetical protein
MSWHQGSQKVSSGATAAVEMGVTPGGSGVRWVWVMQGAGESRLEVFQSRSTPLLGQGMSPRRWLGGLGGCRMSNLGHTCGAATRKVGISFILLDNTKAYNRTCDLSENL